MSVSMKPGATQLTVMPRLATSRASARDNLLFFADLQGLSHRERRRAVDRALERVDLADYGAMKVGGYARDMPATPALAAA